MVKMHCSALHGAGGRPPPSKLPAVCNDNVRDGLQPSREHQRQLLDKIHTLHHAAKRNVAAICGPRVR